MIKNKYFRLILLKKYVRLTELLRHPELITFEG
jgi:hypothetical protein